MNSKIVMIATSVFTGIIGVISTFLPVEILHTFGFSTSETLVLFVQVLGALYIGFAIMNWMAKTVLIGGIYARPLAMGNFTHFMIAAIALLKAALNNSAVQYLWAASIVYLIFAVLFGIVLFTNPSKR